jgi:steroid delta-isomerase-like uncharacterized protein
VTREDVRALFARREDSWRRRDAAALAADHADDGTVHSPTAGRLQGRAAIESVYRLWFTAFPDLEFRTVDLLADGDRAVLVFRATGTHVGEFFGISATNRRFEISGAFIYTVREGRIVHEQRILDFTGLLVQIGVLKARPG